MKNLYLIGETMDVLDRSIVRIPLYQHLNNIKVDTSNKSVNEVVNNILSL